MAAASKEEIWIKALLRKEDVHSLTASLLYSEVWSKVGDKGCVFPKKCECKEHKKLREHAKTINFAIAYGAGPMKIANNLKLTEREARRLLNKYKSVVRNLTRWLEKNAKSAITTRLSYSADPFKRRRTLRDPEDWMLANVGKNNPVQSCGANMIKLSMISLDEKYPIVLTIHDELVLEVPKAQAKAAAKHLKGIMEKAADYCTGIPGLIEVHPTINKSLSKE
jgi:DNA polymerase I-like protein with 3'-5' exonuclease and polymerase domains